MTQAKHTQARWVNDSVRDAAPELLEALEGLRTWCDSNINGVPPEYGKLMNKADAAIAKARGERSTAA